MIRELVGIFEISRMLGVTRQYAWQLAQRRGFPEPAYRLNAGHFWWRDEVEAWAKRSGRQVD